MGPFSFEKLHFILHMPLNSMSWFILKNEKKNRFEKSCILFTIVVGGYWSDIDLFSTQISQGQVFIVLSTPFSNGTKGGKSDFVYSGNHLMTIKIAKNVTT